MSDSPKAPAQSERIITPMAKPMLEEIDEFRWRERLPSRSEAVRTLIRRGLAGVNQENSRGSAG